MNSQEFREFSMAAIDFIIDYTENIRDCSVLPSVEPGYLQKLIPTEIPEKPEKWQDIIKDLERVILPGITHWQSPQFLAYFPTGQSYASIVGEILCAGLGVIGFSWISSPACTELEVAVMNWLGKLMNLPQEFLNCSEGPGGGIIQGSASETTLVGLLAAKQKTVRYLKENDPNVDEDMIKGKFVAYTSNQSNSSVEKSGMLGSVPMRLLPVDSNCSLRGDTFRKAVETDIKNGFIPCYLVATFGTTGTCGVDNIEELAAICKQYNIWLHVDAAYAGAAFICPEYQYLMKGIEKVDSFNVNIHKWLLVNFDCSAMWVKNANYLVDAFNVDRIYLEHHRQQSSSAPDYRHWQIPLGRRFRSIKLWTVLRIYGAEGLQEHVRKQCRLAERFASYVRSDSRFEIIPEPSMALVCFRLANDSNDELTKLLLKNITDRKKLYMVPATYQEKYIIRFVVCSRLTEERDIDYAWVEIKTQVNEILTGNNTCSINNSDILTHSIAQNGNHHIDNTGKKIISNGNETAFHIPNSCQDKKILANEKYL